MFVHIHIIEIIVKWSMEIFFYLIKSSIESTDVAWILKILWNLWHDVRTWQSWAKFSWWSESLPSSRRIQKSVFRSRQVHVHIQLCICVIILTINLLVKTLVLGYAVWKYARSIGPIALAGIAGAIILVLYHVVKSLQLIWRLGTRRFHLRVLNLQMSCSDLT